MQKNKNKLYNILVNKTWEKQQTIHLTKEY